MMGNVEITLTSDGFIEGDLLTKEKLQEQEKVTLHGVWLENVFEGTDSGLSRIGTMVFIPYSSIKYMITEK